MRWNAPRRSVASLSALIVAALLVSIPPRDAFAATDPAQVAILQQLAGMGNPSSAPFNTWTGGDPCAAAWDGVRCSAGGGGYDVVTELVLEDAELTGTLPPSLFDLTTLHTLDLGKNPGLQGSIPTTIGNLVQLTMLILQGCNLSGPVPTTIGNLTQLVYFLVAQNQLSGPLPDQFGLLPKLFQIDIIDNQFNGTLPTFAGASSLVHLHMSRNHLSSIPDEIAQLPSLQHLIVDGNHIVQPFPLSLNGSALSVIYWSGNTITEPLPLVWNLPNLKDFLASNCSIPTQILPSFPQSKVLANLDLSQNKFGGSIPGSLFTDNPNLVNLNLANNALEYALPADIDQAANLQSLFLSGNRLTGRLPDLSGLSKAVSLSFYDNLLTGPLPRLNRSDITLQLYGNPLCSPYTPAKQAPCSPPADLTQYTAPSFCQGFACQGDLYSPSQPLFLQSSLCVCVSPLRADVALYLSSYVVFNQALVDRLEEILFQELVGGKFGLNITKSQVLISAIKSPSSLPSLASTFASDHTTHESTTTVSILFFPPVGDDSWYPRDLPKGIKQALSLRNTDPTQQMNLSEFGSILSVHFHGPAPYNPPLQPASSGLSTGAIVAISVSSAAVAIVLIVALLMRPWEKRGWSNADYEALEGINLQHARRYSLWQLAEATHGFDDSAVLGKGGFGTVYRGVLNGEPVAIKKATEKRRHDGVDFKNEIEMLTAVSHGNLVKLTGFCVEKDEQLLVFEFMEGGALDAWIKGKTGRVLSWKERMRIALDAASALHYLHKEMRPGIIHRDIKPANILLTASLEAKVADFGISKSLPEKGELLQEAVFMGSKGYIDPHFAVSEVLTERSDVFSFGVVLLQLATGQPPVIQGVPLSQVVLHLAFGPHGLSAAVDPKLSHFLRVRADPTAAATAAAAANGAAAAAGGAGAPGSAAGGEVSAGEMVEGLEETFGTFLRVALWCTAEHPSLRPDMEQVVSALRSIRDQLRALPGGGVAADGSLPHHATAAAAAGAGAAVGPVGSIPNGGNGYNAAAGNQHMNYHPNAGATATAGGAGGGIGGATAGGYTTGAAAGLSPGGGRSPETGTGLTGAPSSLTTLWNPMGGSSSGQPGSSWSNLGEEQTTLMDGYGDTGTQNHTLTGPRAR
ncbi:unnamed protein product [Closterium sp. Yama58-4]|nr:unnamed protein product [Closterium sp. Yama58-4]